MSSRYGFLNALAFVCCLGGALAPDTSYAQTDDRGPQGQQQITQLPNGLAATTSAVANNRGLQVSTNVQISVAGVFETRSDATEIPQTSAGSTRLGTTTRGSGPPTTVPAQQNTTPAPPCCANWVVGGSPLSFETGPNGTQNMFGGFSIGGFDFVNVTPGVNAPGGQTTPWRAVGQVIQLDPRALALKVENELGFPPIVLKVNPDPGLAQLESWFWVQNYGGEVRTQSAMQSETHTECRLDNGNLECQPATTSITVDVRETPTLYAWDFGDGRTAQDSHPATFTTSKGLGRAYTDPYTPSYVQHKYVLSSLKFFDAGGFPISLKITWDAAFRVNGGAWQNLGPITGPFTSRHQVRESWPVGVNNATMTIGAAP
jgi:hypothetical protein